MIDARGQGLSLMWQAGAIFSHILGRSGVAGFACGFWKFEQADVTILAWLASFAAVGLYSGPYRITVGLRFIPEAMVIALLPIYSRAASRLGRRGGIPAIIRAWRTGVALVLALATVVFFAATPQTLIVGLLGSRYAVSA